MTDVNLSRKIISGVYTCNGVVSTQTFGTNNQYFYVSNGKIVRRNRRIVFASLWFLSPIFLYSLIVLFGR